MKTSLKRALPIALLSLAFAVPALAADALVLPSPSPLARTMQTVGSAEVTIEYSSPGKKGRDIFGGLLPHGELWRTGANAATKLTLSADATIGGKPVPAGTYAVFTIPSEGGWTVIINKNPNQGGTRSYDQKLDQARFEVKATTIPLRERMTFVFANTTDSSTSLDLEWDTTKVSLPITFETEAMAKANIDKYTTQASGDLANAARYVAGTLKDPVGAMALIDRSIAVHETWFNVWIKAGFLHEQGQNKAAYALARKAWDMGKKADYFFWESQVKEGLDTWKKK